MHNMLNFGSKWMGYNREEFHLCLSIKESEATAVAETKLGAKC